MLFHGVAYGISMSAAIYWHALGVGPLMFDRVARSILTILASDIRELRHWTLRIDPLACKGRAGPSQVTA